MLKLQDRIGKLIKAEESMKKPISHDRDDVGNKKPKGIYEYEGKDEHH